MLDPYDDCKFYMRAGAPIEQYENVKKQGPWTDIYALGATLYFILTKTKPEESIDRKIKDNLIPPSQIDPDIPEQLNNTILKAMAVEKKYRFQSVCDFESALKGEIIIKNTMIEKKTFCFFHKKTINEKQC